MRSSHIAALLVATALSVACGKDGAGPSGPLAGNWAANASGPTTMTMALTHSGSVGGTGFISAPGGSATLAITGSYAAPNVNLTCNPDQAFTQFTFSGQRRGADSLVGVLNGSGFSNLGVVFVRQP